jgi:hypothetical protein
MIDEDFESQFAETIVRNELKNEKELDNILVVLDLPYLTKQDEIKEKFSKCPGGVEKVKLEKGNSLVFCVAVVTFKNSKGSAHGLSLCNKYGGCFDVIGVTAKDFVDGKVSAKKLPKFTMTKQQEKECLIQ